MTFGISSSTDVAVFAGRSLPVLPTHSTMTLAFILSLPVLLTTVYWFFIYPFYVSPLRHLPGPKVSLLIVMFNLVAAVSLGVLPGSASAGDTQGRDPGTVSSSSGQMSQFPFLDVPARTRTLFVHTGTVPGQWRIMPVHCRLL